ncbi:MAG: hypothetical protein QM490_01415 [Candidatus Gracilibacteria bacterium]
MVKDKKKKNGFVVYLLDLIKLSVIKVKFKICSTKVKYFKKYILLTTKLKLFIYKNILFIINKYYLSKNIVNNFIFKHHQYIFIFSMILSIIFISIIFSFNGAIVKYTNIEIKNLVFSMIGIISTIFGISISILLLYIQNISSIYSGNNIDFFLKITKVPKIIFSLFLLIIILDIFLYVNYLNLDNSIIFFLIISTFLISLLLVWLLYSWAINNSSVSNLTSFLTNHIIKQFKVVNKKIDTFILKHKKYKGIALFSQGDNIGNSLYRVITFLLDNYSKQINDKQEKVADDIVNNIRIILINFIHIFKNKFYSYPDFNTLLSSNTTFLGVFVEIYLELNRRAVTILKEDNYKGVNNISNLYKDVILQSMEIDFQGHNPFKDNLILLTSLNSYIDLGKEIIKSNNTECAFRWLDNSKIILVNLIDRDDYVNTENLIKFINQFNKINDREVLNKLLENYKTIFSYIYGLDRNNKLYNLILIKDNLFSEFSSFIVTLFFFRKGKEDYIQHIDYEIQDVGNYINGIFEKGIFENKEVYILLSNIIESIEMLEELKIDFSNNLGLRYFCYSLLDLYKTVDYIYEDLFFNIFYKISARAYKIDNNSNAPLSDFLNKFIVLSIKNIEEFKIDYYLETYDNLIKFYEENKCYKLEKNMYHHLGIICYLLYVNGLEYDILLPLLKDYQNKNNEKLFKNLSVDSIDNLPSHGVPFVNTINKKIISLKEKFYKKNEIYMSDDFNSSFSYWTLNNIDIKKEKIDDFIKLI